MTESHPDGQVDWELPDPKDQPIEAVRLVRDNIRERVWQLASERNWV